MTLGQLLCSSYGASRKTEGMEGDKKMNIKAEHVADHVNLHHTAVDWHIRCPAYMNKCTPCE